MDEQTTTRGGSAGDDQRREHQRPDSQAPTASEAVGGGGAGGSGRSQAATGEAGAGAGALASGARFGRYAIVRLLGQGGMGAVYEAQQESPRRSVALKVIRASYLSPQLLRRFEHESQVLGRLQHPGIAQVYEAGSVKDERGETTPFFAMELIKGVPLTEYAAVKQLGTRERLELVARICDAVYHAHQKGVIHRDLKPGNILVDESGQPKILDFGVARATDSDIQQTTMQTDIGQLIGTVPYMSPEQVGGDPDELDTRSDVYALGVIAYELLAGRLPYDLQKKMIHEAVRVIREDEPTRLSSIDRALRGDVETIVGRALEKDKARRYQSAEALGSDIRRYLKDEPIAARPASTWYQAGKFARRNKALVGGIAATFVVLVAGIIGVSLMLKRALQAESDLTFQIGETNAALRKTREAEAAERRRADELKRVSDFQSRMLGQIDTTMAGVDLMRDVRERFSAALEKAGVPEAERTARVDALRQELVLVNATDTAAAMIDRTILRPAINTIDGQFKDDPATDASLRQALADLYRTIGLYDAAYPLQESALATRRGVLGEEHPETLFSINNMGSLLQVQGKLAEAEPYVREALEKRRRVLGEEHPDTLTSTNNMCFLLHDQGKLDQAEPYYREALDGSRRVLGEEHPETLFSINNMGILLQAQGKLAEAEPYFQEALEKRRRVLGEEHSDTLLSINNMGGLRHAQGKLDQAEPYFRETLEKYRRLLGEEHPGTLISINNIGFLLRAQGRLAEAEPYSREALEKSRRVLGEEHPDTLQSINSMGSLLQVQGKLAEAEPYFREVLEKRRRVLGEEHPNTLTSINNMGVLLQAQGRLGGAEPYLREALEKSRLVLGEEHPNTLSATGNLGRILQQQGNHQDAIDLLVPVEPAARKAFTSGNATRLAIFLTTLGLARVGLGYDAERFSLAEANLLEAHPIFVSARGERHKDTLGCVEGLVELYTAWHTAEPGKEYDAKAAEWKAKLPTAELPAVAPPPSSPG